MRKSLLQRGVRVGHACLVGWWWLTRPKTRGVKVLIQNGPNILLVKHSYGYPFWMLPGGGIDRDESADKAARREICEELSIELGTLKHIGTYQQTIEYKNDTVDCFSATVDDPTFVIDNVEIVAAAWYPPTQLPIDRTPSVDKVVAMVSAANS